MLAKARVPRRPQCCGSRHHGGCNLLQVQFRSAQLVVAPPLEPLSHTPLIFSPPSCLLNLPCSDFASHTRLLWGLQSSLNLQCSRSDKNGKCEEPARPFGRGGREGGVAAPCHEVSLRRKGQQKPAAWAFGRGGNRGCAPSIQEIQKFEFFWARGRLLRRSC